MKKSLIKSVLFGWYIFSNTVSAQVVTDMKAITTDDNGFVWRADVNNNEWNGTFEWGFGEGSTWQEHMRFQENGLFRLQALNKSQFMIDMTVDSHIRVGNLFRSSDLLTLAGRGNMEISVDDNNTNSGTKFFRIMNGQNEQLRVTGAGDVGIGTTTPSASLHVAGNALISDKSKFQIDTSQADYVKAGNLYSSFDALRLASLGVVEISVDDNNTDSGTKFFRIMNGQNEQLRVTGNGKVGIGTTTPSASLHVAGNALISDKSKFQIDTSQADYVKAGNLYSSFDALGLASHGDVEISVDDNNTDSGTKFFRIMNGQNEQLRVTGNGKVGIGTTTPSASLHIKSNGGLIVEDEDGLSLQIVTTKQDYNKLNMGGNSNGLLFSINNASKILMKNTGSIIIGNNVIAQKTSSALEQKYSLFVQKGILTEDLAFANVSNWADYVFEEDYDLLPLEEVEAFITKNKHLPGIAAGSKIETEGYTVKSMNVKFMEKIEELTLYAIDQQKQINALKQQVEHLLMKNG